MLQCGIKGPLSYFKILATEISLKKEAWVGFGSMTFFLYSFFTATKKTFLFEKIYFKISCQFSFIGNIFFNSYNQRIYFCGMI